MFELAAQVADAAERFDALLLTAFELIYDGVVDVVDAAEHCIFGVVESRIDELVDDVAERVAVGAKLLVGEVGEIEKHSGWGFRWLNKLGKRKGF